MIGTKYQTHEKLGMATKPMKASPWFVPLILISLITRHVLHNELTYGLTDLRVSSDRTLVRPCMYNNELSLHRGRSLRRAQERANKVHDSHPTNFKLSLIYTLTYPLESCGLKATPMTKEVLMTSPIGIVH